MQRVNKRLTPLIVLLVVMGGVVLLVWIVLCLKAPPEVAGPPRRDKRAPETDRPPATTPASQPQDEIATVLDDMDLPTQPADEGAITDEFLSIPAVVRARINAQIQKLRNETTADSLAELLDVDMFFWPGPPPSSGRMIPHGEKRIPLPAWQGQDDPHIIMSNRRFLKLREELSGLPKLLASQQVVSHIETALTKYRELYDACIAEKAQYYTPEAVAGQTSIAGPGFITQNPPAGQIVLQGARLKVLSLIWLSGDLNLTGAASGIKTVVNEALRQREQLYGDSELIPFFRAEMLAHGSLYNRQILATALCGACFGENERQSLTSEVGLTWEEARLPHFDARLSLHDLPVRFGVFRPDYSRGQLTVHFLAPLDDKQFERVAEAAGVRLPPDVPSGE